jgi:hypothetical protein
MNPDLVLFLVIFTAFAFALILGTFANRAIRDSKGHGGESLGLSPILRCVCCRYICDRLTAAS